MKMDEIFETGSKIIVIIVVIGVIASILFVLVSSVGYGIDKWLTTRISEHPRTTQIVVPFADGSNLSFDGDQECKVMFGHLDYDYTFTVKKREDKS